MRKTLKQVFESHIYYSLDGCWYWTGRLSGFGHGRITLGKINGYAHRVSYQFRNGPIPKGLCVCHTCDNPSCVNPDHLFLGTKWDNYIDMCNKKRGDKHFLPGELNVKSKFTREDILKIRETRLKEKVSLTSIAKSYGAHRSTIGRICSGERHKNYL